MTSPITPAKIHWTDDAAGHAVPVSDVFDDVYFSHADGFLESRYVFIEHNRLPERFAELFAAGGRFVIAETGFGTGLNFIATCQLWMQTAQAAKGAHSPTLYFISTEKHPLNPEDLARALSVWAGRYPDIAPLIAALAASYPLALAGCHRRHFHLQGTLIILDLWLGDATDSLQRLAYQWADDAKTRQSSPAPKVDAWFLDGFAPSKNSELWSAALFDTIAQLSAPNTILATFTAAGNVKRELLRIGASVTKVKGYGRKREMLTAVFLPSAPSLPAQTMLHPIRSALIIGAGVAGLSIAHALASRGIQITLIDKQAPLAGASGNPRALFSPKLSLIAGADKHLPTISYLYAHAYYRTLAPIGTDAIFSPVGVIDCLLPTQKSTDKLQALVSAYPESLIHPITPWTNSEFSALVPQAGLVNPRALAQAILAHPLIYFRQQTADSLSQQADGICLTSAQGDTLSADTAIITAGWESHLIDARLFNPRKIRGQVSWLIDNELAPHFDTLTTGHAIKYDGYACTFGDDDGKTDTLLFGASFVRNDTDCDVRVDEHEFNVSKFRHAFPEIDIDANRLQGRASIRAQTPDYHPIVGRIDAGMDDRLYVMTGMGSKGFSFAPFCAEMLAGLMLGEFLPCDASLIHKVSPQRARLQTPIDQQR